MLFENQQSLDIASLKQYASQLGLDTKAFNKCLDVTREWLTIANFDTQPTMTVDVEIGLSDCILYVSGFTYEVNSSAHVYGINDTFTYNNWLSYTSASSSPFYLKNETVLAAPFTFVTAFNTPFPLIGATYSQYVVDGSSAAVYSGAELGPVFIGTLSPPLSLTAIYFPPGEVTFDFVCDGTLVIGSDSKLYCQVAGGQFSVVELDLQFLTRPTNSVTHAELMYLVQNAPANPIGANTNTYDLGTGEVSVTVELSKILHYDATEPFLMVYLRHGVSLTVSFTEFQ